MGRKIKNKLDYFKLIGKVVILKIDLNLKRGRNSWDDAYFQF